MKQPDLSVLPRCDYSRSSTAEPVISRFSGLETSPKKADRLLRRSTVVATAFWDMPAESTPTQRLRGFIFDNRGISKIAFNELNF